MTYFEALSCNLFEENEYNNERLRSRQQLNRVSSQTSLSCYRYVNPLAPELDIYSLAHHLCKM